MDYMGYIQTKASFAINLRDSFLNYLESINPNYAKMCSFSVTNPGPSMKDICVLETAYNATMDAFPFPTDNIIFGATNFAFFIPKQHLLMTEMWFRQHNDPSKLSFIIHSNNGCQDNCHTDWATVNEGYMFKINPPGLSCCHSGPEGCYCDTVYYKTMDGETEKCLTANYTDHSVSMGLCENKEYPLLAKWRETHYNGTFIQIENMATTKKYIKNSYLCLGQDEGSKNGICEEGTKMSLVACYERDNRLNLFNWDSGKIKAIGCGDDKDLCVDFDGTGLVLKDCDRATKIARE